MSEGKHQLCQKYSNLVEYLLLGLYHCITWINFSHLIIIINEPVCSKVTFLWWSIQILKMVYRSIITFAKSAFWGRI